MSRREAPTTTKGVRSLSLPPQVAGRTVPVLWGRNCRAQMAQKKNANYPAESTEIQGFHKEQFSALGSAGSAIPQRPPQVGEGLLFGMIKKISKKKEMKPLLGVFIHLLPPPDSGG